MNITDEMREIILIAEKIHPVNLTNQFNLFRKYVTGPTFDAFCQLRNISGEYKVKFHELVFK